MICKKRSLWLTMVCTTFDDIKVDDYFLSTKVCSTKKRLLEIRPLGHLHDVSFPFYNMIRKNILPLVPLLMPQQLLQRGFSQTHRLACLSELGKTMEDAFCPSCPLGVKVAVFIPTGHPKLWVPKGLSSPWGRLSN